MTDSFPLYQPQFEHDACGVGFVAKISGEASHDIVHRGLLALERMEHRGAVGAEPNTGDGAGILIQIPDKLFQRECALGRIQSTEPGRTLTALPKAGDYAVGLFFGSPDPQASALAKLIFAMIVRQEGQKLLGFRRVPTDSRDLGATAKSVEPAMDHVFIEKGSDALDEQSFERKLFVIRKRFQSMIRQSGIDDRAYFYVASLSSRTLVYKGMLTSLQLRDYFDDLSDPRTESALAMFHSRFSTNTFPSWELAHPYRFIAHNGEINTLRGNLSWMRAREALLSSKLLGDDVEKVLPIVHEGLSDSACLDSALELLTMAGRSLPHALMMLMPEAYESSTTMSAARKAFYTYHSCVAEPWDGPACVCFSDGTQIGATLDRNGLRPARYWITKDGLIVLASETGVMDVEDENVLEKGRLSPGKMLVVDFASGRVVHDDEIKERIATEHPYEEWLAQNFVSIDDLPLGEIPPKMSDAERTSLQQAFGYGDEDLRLLLAPMAVRGEEAIGSMGNDTPLAVLSKRHRSLFDYFHQLFAQVTNPPLDSIREKLVTSVASAIGPEGNLLEAAPESCRMVRCESPFLNAQQMARFRALSHFDRKREGRTTQVPPDDAARPFTVTVLDTTFRVGDGPEGLEPALKALFAKADIAISQGSKVLILSDRGVSKKTAPIPSLLAVAGLHNHLVREKKRSLVTILVETGEAREVHHFAALVGYGASAIHPYLALETLPELRARGLVPDGISDEQLEDNYLHAIEKGVVKVMSKMGISTIASYRGAQIFEAIGLSKNFISQYFAHTPSRIGGMEPIDLAEDLLALHHDAFLPRTHLPLLENAGDYQWRRDGEMHLFNPETVFKLQHATREKSFAIFREYTKAVDEHAASNSTLRGLLAIREDARTPIPLSEVEPVESILKRFATGAMSYGSLSAEAHETLAIAMNRIGAKSNSGEGGEDPKRYVPDANGDSRRSAIKQVASARFGVTSAYLVSADEIQIKMAQGAKPGEGGQLPGNKVYPWIAKVRFATEGVGLISPPPHHDIYSIEDLAQLIYDLRRANSRARISVKLVSEVGVGTVAAGVAKAKSDVILISGYDGGTGASPLTSQKHAGAPWELGLAEAQQTLVKNGLRDRVVLQVDGQMKTGRDVVVAALLGAEEYGFATAPLVVMGCVLMRVCHLDTCPVGVATQNPALRKNFTGKAEHVIRFFRFVAEEIREWMAKLGFSSMDEMIGRTDLLETKTNLDRQKLRELDLSPILAFGNTSKNAEENGIALHASRAPRDVEQALDHELIDACEPALFERLPVQLDRPVRVVDRAVGTLLGSEITRRYGESGLPDGTVELRLRGSAGQSLGAFLPRGITIKLSGDANDYVGKGLSGGIIAIAPHDQSSFVAHENVIAGNVALYGATFGRAFFRGSAGERFAVRNSGAVAVVEGVGDHGCEYMTGGRIVVIGKIGRNFAAGMSGGIAYLLGTHADLGARVNAELVRLEPLDDDDAVFVEELLYEHVQLTKSVRGAELIAPFDRTRFTKVMPVDYRKALERARTQQLERFAAAE